MILIIQGSPNKAGQTKQLLEELLKENSQEVKIIDAYSLHAAPCDDCRYCHHKAGCSKQDDMKEIYDLLPLVDTFILATPLYFATFPAPVLTVISRLQTYYSTKYIRKGINPKIKKGLLIVNGGGIWESMFIGVQETFKMIKYLFGFEETMELLIPDCDRTKAIHSTIFIENKATIQSFLK